MKANEDDSTYTRGIKPIEVNFKMKKQAAEILQMYADEKNKELNDEVKQLRRVIEDNEYKQTQ